MPTYTFTPPSVVDRYPWRGSLTIKITRATTVLKKNGSYTQGSDPTAEAVDAADIAYLGGRTYTISSDEAAALTAAGYGAYVATS